MTPSHPHRSLICLLPVLVALVISLAACSKPASIESMMETAKQAQEHGDLKTAVIQLKNVLQRNPQHGEARYLLGSIYLKLGVKRGAETNLREAIHDKYKVKEALPLLARSLFEQGKFQKLLDETRSSDYGEVALQPSILSLRGHAQLSLGNVDEAAHSFDAALEKEPDYAPALLGQARLAIQKRDAQGALDLVNKAVTADPKDLDAWLMKGDLERSVNGIEAAKIAYRKALDLAPDNVSANFNMASAIMAGGHNDDAKKYVDAILKTAPHNPLGKYLQGLMAFREKRYKEADEAVTQVIKDLPNYLPARALSAATTYFVGDYRKAEERLQSVVNQYPGSIYLRKLLAQTLLKNNKPQKALDVLGPLINSGSTDSGVLALIANAYYQEGDISQAKRYFEKVVRENPNDPKVRAGLGMARLAAGETNRALVDLEAAVAAGDDKANMLLVTSLVSIKQYEKALSALEVLEKKRPKDPEVFNERGTILIALNKRVEARLALERALEIQPGYFPATMNLATLDIREHHPEAAQKRYEKILELSPSNVQAMSALAKLALISGDKDKAIEWLERAKKIQPRSFSVNYRLGSLRFEEGKYYEAISPLQDALETHPDHPQALNMLGYSQIQAGLAGDAIPTYTKLTTRYPKSAEAFYGLGTAQAARGYRDSAIQSLQKAVALQPGFPVATYALSNLLLETGKTDDALKIGEQEQHRHPNAALGFSIEGNVRMSQQKYGQAVSLFTKAFDKEKAGITLIALHKAMSKAGQGTQGDQRLVDWLDAHPQDTQVRLYYADVALRKRDFTLAIGQYRHVLEQDPQNLGVLHNLSWAYQQDNDMAKAMEIAENAYKINPDSPAVLADLAELSLQTGDTPRAVKLLEQALKILPTSSRIRYRLARAYLKIGNKDQARLELKQLIDSEVDFPGRSDANALYEQLSR